MNAQAEQQVCEGIDDYDTPNVGVEALKWRLDEQLDERGNVGAEANVQHGSHQAKDGKRQQHRDHDVKGGSNHRGHALAEVDLELLDARKLDEQHRGEKANDNGAKESAGTRVARGEEASYLLAIHVYRLGHGHEERRNGHNHTGDIALEPRVVRVAITNHTAQQDGRDAQRSLRERIAPVLSVRERISAEEQGEHHVVDEDRDARKDVQRHDGRKCIAQAAQMYLRPNPS